MQVPQGAPARLRRGTGRSAVLALLWLACVASQAMTIREFRTLEAKDKRGKDYGSYYLVGVMEGLRDASDRSLRNGETTPFCIENRRLEPSMARTLYATELKRNAGLYEADMPVQLVMTNALANSFRCTH